MTKLNELPGTTSTADTDLLLIQQGGADKQVDKKTLFRETVFAITHAATVDVDPANGGIQTWTLTGNASVTFGSFLEGQSVTLMITAAANTITWPTMNWVGGTAPTLSTTEQTVVELWKVGTTVYGANVGDVA